MARYLKEFQTESDYNTYINGEPYLPNVSLINAIDKVKYNPTYQQRYLTFKVLSDGYSSLNYIKCLATDITASQCTYNWINGVSSTGTFVKDASMTNWTTGNSGIPNSWTVEDAS